MCQLAAGIFELGVEGNYRVFQLRFVSGILGFVEIMTRRVDLQPNLMERQIGGCFERDGEWVMKGFSNVVVIKPFQYCQSGLEAIVICCQAWLQPEDCSYRRVCTKQNPPSFPQKVGKNGVCGDAGYRQRIDLHS